MYHGHGQQGIYEAASTQLYCRCSKPGYTAFNCNLANHNKTVIPMSPKFTTFVVVAIITNNKNNKNSNSSKNSGTVNVRW